MTVTPTIVRHEFIGLDAAIVKSTNPGSVGIEGKVVDETRKTFVIRHKNQDKVVIKDSSVFQFVLSDGTLVEIEGRVLVGRPEDRIKKRSRRRW